MDQVTVAVVLGAALAGLVQGLSGGAFGLVALGIWTWTLDPSLTGPLVVCGSVVGQVLSAGALRRGLDWRLLLPMLAGGAAGIPLGVALLKGVDPVVFKFAVGVLLVLWCPAMLLGADLPRVSGGGRLADGAVGFIGGAMGGLGGLSGPAPALWGALRGWSRDVQRSVSQGFNLAMQCLAMAAYVASGSISAEALRLFPWVAAAVLIPTFVGMRLFTRFDDATFRRTILALLGVSGVVLIVTTLPKLL